MKAILVIETDAQHIEDLHVDYIWNDCYPVDLGKEVHFKPMPQKKSEEEERAKFPFNEDLFYDNYIEGWNACIDEILGETE